MWDGNSVNCDEIKYNWADKTLYDRDAKRIRHQVLTGGGGLVDVPPATNWLSNYYP